MSGYQVGDKVEYYAIGGGGGGNKNSSTTGVIEEVLTETSQAGTNGSTVKASDEEPRFVIKNDNTGKSTAYKQMNLVRKVNSRD